jgi:hypothetical protein
VADAQQLPGTPRACEAAPASLRMLMRPSARPVPPFRHFQRLTDTVGLAEHADGVMPRYGQGYRVDDVACGLVVVCREPSPSAELITLGRRCLYFLAQAQAKDGKFRSRLGADRRWRGKPEAHDAWGRSPWALGTAAARGPTAGIRQEARRAGRRCGVAVAGPLAQLRERGHRRGRHRGRRETPPRSPSAEWPAHARLAAGRRARNGHPSVVPAGGWALGEDRPAFDQHPGQVAALADACARAAAVTGDTTWLTGVEMSVTWLLGGNDAGIPMLDERTGGCSGALSRTSRSRNQGAESTLAMISVLQHGRHLDAAAAR